LEEVGSYNSLFNLQVRYFELVLHNLELRDVYSAANVVKSTRLVQEIRHISVYEISIMIDFNPVKIRIELRICVF
jgi:hypothetical protein